VGNPPSTSRTTPVTLWGARIGLSCCERVFAEQSAEAISAQDAVGTGFAHELESRLFRVIGGLRLRARCGLWPL
jgi:hypothetical protein